MSAFLGSRLAIGLLALFSLLTTVALTIGGISLTRAGVVSVLPVTSQQSGISVCGHGKATAKPDQGRLSLGVFANAASAQDARNQAAQVMTNVLAALKSQGVDDQDIQTEYIAIQPQYAYDSGTQRITGYSATNTVSATIHAVENTGKVIDAVTERGGNNILVNGAQFSSGSPEQASVEAQKSAVADAKRQAEQVAASAGASIGQAISIQVGGCGGSQPQPVYYAADKANAGSVTTPVQPGQVNVTVDVAVVYALR
jgi:uncharacterized protein